MYLQKSLSPLPLAVAEVLSTAKGTAFYVLTVAGDHGIPPESDAPASDGKTEDRTSPDQTAFLTEVEVKEKDEEKPVYIQSVDVADSVILQVKKAYVWLVVYINVSQCIFVFTSRNKYMYIAGYYLSI